MPYIAATQFESLQNGFLSYATVNTDDVEACDLTQGRTTARSSSLIKVLSPWAHNMNRGYRDDTAGFTAKGGIICN